MRNPPPPNPLNAPNPPAPKPTPKPPRKLPTRPQAARVSTYVGVNRNVSPLPTKPPWNATRSVTVLMILAFLLYAIDRDLLKGVDTTKPESTHDFLFRYAAWGFLFIVLVAGTDFGATRELSVAFALLILLSVLFIAPSAKNPNKILGAQVFNQIAKAFELGNNPVGTKGGSQHTHPPTPA